jgi:hypothetical protein
VKPYCFGSPVVVSATSRTCQGCSFAAGCVSAAAQVLAGMPDEPRIRQSRLDLAVTRTALLGAPQGVEGGRAARKVVESSRGVKRVALTAREEALLATLPIRVGKQVRRLLERGWFDYAHAELRAGRNPADKGWKRVMCQLLIEGGQTRQALQLAFQEQLGLSPESARVQASLAMSVFTAGRLVVETQGRLRIASNSARAL